MIEVSLSLTVSTDAKIHLQNDRIRATFYANGDSAGFRDSVITVYCGEPAIVYFAREYVKIGEQFTIKGHLRPIENVNRLNIDCIGIVANKGDMDQKGLETRRRMAASTEMSKFGNVFEALLVESLGWSAMSSKSLNHHQWMVANRAAVYLEIMDDESWRLYDNPNLYFAANGDRQQFMDLVWLKSSITDTNLNSLNFIN